MSKQTLITSSDPKGLKFTSLCRDAYDKAKLDDGRAQRLNENGGEFQAGLRELIARFSVSNQFASEEVASSYAYPDEYRGPKPIGEQVDILAKVFSLSLGFTSDFIEKVLPTLTLPEGADGWFAIPSLDAVAQRFFPEVTDPAERYCRAVNLVMEKLGASRKFVNYRKGELTTDRLRQHARTLHALDVIAETQQGDILIVPAQFGKLHRGQSVRRAREVMGANEFGLGAFAVGCMALTHPERFVRWEQLHVDCAGDEFAPGAGGGFVDAPLFGFDVGKLGFRTYWFSGARGGCGSVSAFLPQ